MRTKSQLRARVINPESPFDLYEDVVITKNDWMSFLHKSLGDTVTWGHGDKGRYELRGQVGKGLRLENEFLTTWEVACDAIAHEFVAEDAFNIERLLKCFN